MSSSGGGYGDISSNKISPQEANEKLAESTLEGKWETVVEIYNSYPESRTVAISDSGETALHVAIELNEEEIVKKLMEAINKHEVDEEGGRKKALEVRNQHGDTPLHVAASRGFVKLCMCIVGEENRLYLISLKNKKGETPLFLAALNWNKHAFAYLYDATKHSVILNDLIRQDGDSILHCAIRREYFDLAVIIVHCYDFLITHTNKNGITPLEALATRPSAFRSASKLSLWKLTLYHCILVEPLDVETTMDKILRKMKKPPSEKLEFPENYATLCQALLNLKSLLVGSWKEEQEKEKHDAENPQKKNSEKHEVGFLPPNYSTLQQFIRSMYVHTLGLSGVALKDVKKIKKKHQWSRQLLDKLMEKPYEAFTGRGGQPDLISGWEFDTGVFEAFHQFNQGENSSRFENVEKEKEEKIQTPMLLSSPITDSRKSTPNQNKEAKDGIDPKETAFLVAAKNGIVEMVIKILSKIPSAIHNTNTKKENVLLVAVMNRQPFVVETLRMKSKPEVWNNLVLAADDDENTMLHLAAYALGDEKPWQIPGSALQMMWDIKWFEYIKSIVPQHFNYRTNKNSKTAGEIFKTEHKDLVKEGSEWLRETSESCSVVAGLVAGVSFATASAVPGGTSDEGKPLLERQPAFEAFAVSSLIGLCFSVTGLIMFLAILTSRKEARDFRRGLPTKLLLGLSSLFVSIIAMFVSFCCGHFFIINHKYKTFLFPFYAATSIPVAFYALAQFPLYFDLLTAILSKVPHASDKVESF
ncbi:uncharacterized protein LOC107496829 [Arachis duranensis]|uniref:PGG domain-containing protein n=2 Tax=Arachis TaxID=3817 RepID=A0A445C4S4_ARAHY|nr:uncharacterized protein LOC107496829 [Arachis duranensis]QHO27114.1 Ankyrin [Arachis hypogaea]RYR45900.1 hypothetical protein Ahy_A07g031666 [Arachis hypogaea]